jgi:hypothetical protein
MHAPMTVPSGIELPLEDVTEDGPGATLEDDGTGVLVIMISEPETRAGADVTAADGTPAAFVLTSRLVPAPPGLFNAVDPPLKPGAVGAGGGWPFCRL